MISKIIIAAVAYFLAVRVVGELLAENDKPVNNS